MKDDYFKGDPLVGTRWENLTFGEYYYFFSDEEKQELKEYLENINAPFGSDINDEDYQKGNYKTWRDIVSLSEDEFNYYRGLVKARDKYLPIPGIHRNPLEGTLWENLTIYDYIKCMSYKERKELLSYLERVHAPFCPRTDDGVERWSWRDITTTLLEIIESKFNIPGVYVYNKELGIFESPHSCDSEEFPF